jgi:hypothetical protein
MHHIKTGRLTAVTIGLLFLGPVCYAIGFNLPDLAPRLRQADVNWLENIKWRLTWFGTLLCFAGEGAMCMLAIRVGRLARDAWSAGKIGDSASWWFGSISLVLAALWFALFTWYLHP